MMDRALMQERMIKDAMGEHTIDEMREGSYRIVQDRMRQLVVAYVRDSEENQYNIVAGARARYATEEKAQLAVALMTRPGRLTWQETSALLVMLEGE